MSEHPPGNPPNDNPLDETPLDRNLSRLLEIESEQPSLPAESEAKILSALKTRQEQLYPRREPAMTASVSLPKKRAEHSQRDMWIGAASLIALAVAGLIALNVLQQPPSQVPGDPVVVQEVKEVIAGEVQRETLADGTVVIARAGTTYSVTEARHIQLDKGDLYLIVAPAEQPFVVRTAEGTATAYGTRFAVSAADGTSAAVAQGVVELKGNGGVVELRAGQQGELAKGQRPTREPAPRLSHVVSWARDHLAQQDLLVEGEKKNGLIAMDPWGQEVRLTLRKYDVDVVIEDGIARTTIDQTFFNHNPWNTEGTFYFPLPPDASVSRLAMYVFGKLNEGGMVERGRGQQIYNDILYQRRDPALLEMMEGNVFKMRIFPLEGRQEKRVFLSYTQTLDELYGSLRYWFPMDHTHNVARELSIRVRVKDGANLVEPHSATHNLETIVDGNDLVMTYTAKDTKPDQDFLLTLLPFEELPDARLSMTKKGDQQFLFARLNPKFSGEMEHQPRQWIVLNDASASRTEIEAKAQQYILDRLIQEADDEDTISVIDLNTEARLRTKKFVSVKKAREQGLPAAAGRDWTESAAHLLGATNMEVGLKRVSWLIELNKLKNPHIVYLGDGVATDGVTEVSSLVRMLPEASTFVGIGVGKKVEARFLQAAADATGGMFAVMNPDEDLEWRTFDLLAALNTPRLTGLDVSLQTGGSEPLNVIAYPTSRVLSDGETLQVVARAMDDLPETLVVRGKLGSQAWEKTYDLRKADANAEYIPRLWAKRHLDELLKSGDEFKDEIVKLSKEYYVVTPHTSLIVLEDDAMYEEYKVERGRKDHWALYPAPKEIEVVKEPVDWSRWGWWGGFAGEDGKVEATSKPQSVEDIVESVQFRINAPFYYWKPQQSDNGRYTLYHLTDSEADPATMLTYLYIIAGGKPLPIEPREAGDAGEGQDQPPAGEAAAAVSGPVPPLMEVGKSLDGLFAIPAVSYSRTPTLSKVPYVNRLFAKQSREPMALINGFMPDWSRGPALQQQGQLGAGRGLKLLMSMEALDGRLMRRGETLLGHRSIRFGDFEGEKLGLRQIGQSSRELSSFRFVEMARKKRLAQPMMASTLGTTSDFADFGLAPPLMQSYYKALNGRWDRIDRDIRQFNRTYGYWDDFNGTGTWNTLDLRRSGSARWYGGLEGILSEVAESDEELEEFFFDEVVAAGERLPAADFTAPVAESAIMPMMGWFERDRKRALMPQIQMAIYSEAMRALPGTCAVLAVDHLVPRREALKKEGEDKARAVKITQFAIDSVDAASSRLENSGPFWSWQGWNYKPQPASVNLPQVQAYPRYNWSFDLTRYTDGLYSTNSDVLDEVARQYGTAKPAGKISDDARAIVEKARTAIKPVKIRFSEEGPELLAASGDRFAVEQQTEMYLKEQLVCDGEHIYHAYPEVGLVARRTASKLRLGSLRMFAPHFIQPVETLAARFDIELGEAGESDFTLRLTPVGQTDEHEEQIEMRIQVGTDGLIRGKTLVINDEQVLRLQFAYNDGNVEVRWIDKEDETLAEASYEYEALTEEELAAKPFEPNLDDQVVIDMPLRRPSYYAEQLEQLNEKNTTDDFVNLKRHFALSSIQQLQWRRWGQTNPEAQAAMTDCIAKLHNAGRKALLGDLTLMGSAGVYNVAQLFDGKTDVPGQHPVYQYFKARSSSWNIAKTLSADHPDTLVGHLAGYYAATQNDEGFDAFLERYEDSPLLLAAAWFRGSWGSDRAPMMKLVDNPRWRGMAILLAGQNLPEQNRGMWAQAFKDWHDDLQEAGFEMAIPPHVSGHLQQHDGGKIWREIVDSKWKAVQEMEGRAPLLAFAEQALSWGENEVADKALALYDQRTKDDTSLLVVLAKGQALWTGGRVDDALKHYEQILTRLEKEQVAASPALLAATARLAQQTGNHGRAIELEERSMAAEHPYLPDMINLQAFRQRYNWLWQQYQAKVQEAVNANDQEAIDQWVARAEATWQRWFEVDRDNPGMVQQMATLQATANREEASWLYLSTLVDQKPKDAVSYYNVGAWYLGRGEKDTAQQYYATAFTWDTANPRWLVERARILDDMGRGQEARDVYRQVINGEWAPGLQGYVNQAREAVK